MNRLKVWLVISLIFCAGFAAGVLVTKTVTRRIIRTALAHPEFVRERIERSLDRELGLDSRQRAEVHEIMVRSHEQLKDLRRGFQPRVRSLLAETRNAIAAVLTPEQRQRFEKLLAKRPLPAVAVGD